MEKTNNKLKTFLITLSLMFVLSYSAVYAGNISEALSGILSRIVGSLDVIGGNSTNAAQQGMSDISNKTQSAIDNIEKNAEDDLAKQLDEYKNAELEKKNQELDSLINDVNQSVQQKKLEKLDEYKQKIDQEIDKEYDKLLDDLKLQ